MGVRAIARVAQIECKDEAGKGEALRSPPVAFLSRSSPLPRAPRRTLTWRQISSRETRCISGTGKAAMRPSRLARVKRCIARPARTRPARPARCRHDAREHQRLWRLDTPEAWLKLCSLTLPVSTT